MNEINAFSGINKEDKNKLLNMYNALNIHYKDGETILSNVAMSNNFYVIESGKVEVIRYNFDGTKNIIETIEKGDIFGSFVGSNSDEIYIVAIEDTDVYSFSYQKLLNRSGRNIELQNKLMDNIIKLLSYKIQSYNERIDMLSEKTIRNKLLKYFNYLSRKQLTKNIILPFTLSDLASYLSVDRSAMMREIKQMKEDGIIDSKGKYFIIKY